MPCDRPSDRLRRCAGAALLAAALGGLPGCATPPRAEATWVMTDAERFARLRADDERERHGLANEAALWREIEPALSGPVGPGEWLYQRGIGRPPDMGYWIGKRICESYVARAPDRRAAITQLLELRDPVQILRDSGYSPDR